MSYEAAVNKSWDDLVKLNPANNISVKFLDDEYSVDIAAKKILSLSCNIAAKDFIAIIILHYLVSFLKGLPPLAGEWLTFREFSGIEGYYDAFKIRCIEPIIRRGIKNKNEDYARIVDAFEGVSVLVKFWKGDDEFSPDANIYFDKSITKIFCTEDIIVLGSLVASKL
ncbi:MAG: DUF3786 domain-containing protein [Candidatus Omnitrophica bacterium]|nr:DUF3786 domain-containing protein [Candidatus Omnitrophota bacterium]